MAQKPVIFKNKFMNLS